MKLLHLIFFLLMTMICGQLSIVNAQTLSPHVTSSTGGYATAGSNSLSWTMGEPFCKSIQNGNSMLTEGFQQPYILLKILNLKAFIQGFYSGGGQMRPVLYSNNLSSDPSACDSVKIELHAAVSPYDMIVSVTVLLHTDGNATAKFPSFLKSNSYFIVIRQRNTLETWSKNPVVFNSSTVNFDLTKK